MNYKFYRSPTLIAENSEWDAVKKMKYKKQLIPHDVSHTWYLDVKACSCKFHNIKKPTICPICGNTGVRKKFSRRK